MYLYRSLLQNSRCFSKHLKIPLNIPFPIILFKNSSLAGTLFLKLTGCCFKVSTSTFLKFYSTFFVGIPNVLVAVHVDWKNVHHSRFDDILSAENTEPCAIFYLLISKIFVYICIDNMTPVTTTIT